MSVVIEDVMIMTSDQPLRSIERDEHSLLAVPYPSTMPVKLWRDHPLLTVAHFPQEYQARPFAPPRGVYENDQIRIEWQTMDNRQPFYHRNCDVDEISYQIDGERTLMTELGVIEHRPGEFSRIPRGVAHDNYGRAESHLLFYVPAPAVETCPAPRTSEPIMPPFPGWAAGQINEAVTQCMGSVGHDITVFPIDEQVLLDRVDHEDDRIPVLSVPKALGSTWLYQAEQFRMRTTTFGVDQDAVRRYRRTLDADEIQYQISGRRTLLTQRGIVELEPGDFVRVPLGIAHAAVGQEPGSYISVLSHRELPQIADTARTAQPCSPENLASLTGERSSR
jgi:quercetin dioxygenase-like cupin family protein